MQRDAAARELTTVEMRDQETCEAMRCERAKSEERARLLRKLVKLLGKDGLQGALVADALDDDDQPRQRFLQRLTGGTLQLSIQQDGRLARAAGARFDVHARAAEREGALRIAEVPLRRRDRVRHRPVRRRGRHAVDRDRRGIRAASTATVSS